MNMTKKAKRNIGQLRSAIAADKARKVGRNPRVARSMLLTAVCVVTALPGFALAASGPWDTMGTQVLAIFTGGLTRTIAIISVIACGIAALAGKLSWDWAIKIIVGIVLIFGGAAVVDYLIAAAS